MDGVTAEGNEENDNTGKPLRRRHSSILKPPRSPLQDLRGGNETVQESNAFRSKKSSRRVSFADTIKVFQTESHMKTVRKSEIIETEAGEHILSIQNQNSEDKNCEITGMNTLLCGPIQTKLQQKEFSVMEHNHGSKHADDQTVIFSDENQMDLTTSHTVMITKGLLDCTKNEKSPKIDTTSFLANLKLHAEDSRMKKGLNFSKDQNTSSEKKINFNDFIKRLKPGKYTSSRGPDKENSEIPIYSKESGSASSTQQMNLSLNVDENISNRTRIFREQDDGMNFTQCHTAIIQTLVPTSNEVKLQEFKGDVTIHGDDIMDLTSNHTMKILPTADDNLFGIENQTQNPMMDITKNCGTNIPGKQTVFENKQNAAFKNPSLNSDDKMHIIRSHVMESQTHTVTKTSNQDAIPLTLAPESVCSSSAIQGYKTVFYSSCNDAMDLTKCLSSMKEEKNLLVHDDNSKMSSNPDASFVLREKTIYSGEDSMEITKSHTIAIDNQIFIQDQTNVQIPAAPISEKEMLQNYITMSEYGKVNESCISGPHISRERLQQRLANPLSIALTDKKIEPLADEDKDLTESPSINSGSQLPLVPYNLATENSSKPHSQSKSLSDEWEKMPNCHMEPSQGPDIITENILTDTWGKEGHPVLKNLPYLDKKSPQSSLCNQDITTSHNIVHSGQMLDKQVALGNNRNIVSCEKSLFSTTKPFSSEEQSDMKNHNAVNSHVVKLVLGQNSKLPEPPRKCVGDPTSDCSHDKVFVCSEEEQNMDLTKSHTIVIGFGPSEVQELDENNLEHTTSKLTTVSRQITVEVEKCDKNSKERTGACISDYNMNVLEGKRIHEPGFLKDQNVKICGRKSVDRLKIDRTIIFSEDDKNDMDITKSYTVEINRRLLLDKRDSHLVPLGGTSKTILYTCGQDDMEITRSHTIALECKTVSPDEIASRPADKTVMFVDNPDELEMTKSHTVFIDCQAEEKTVLPDRPNFDLFKRKSTGKPTMTYNPPKERVFFPENCESDHPAEKGSQLIPQEGLSNNCPVEKAVTFIVDHNMEVSKSTILKNVNDTQKPSFPNVSGKSHRRKSLRLKNDKAIAFSENDRNDMDITQSCTVDINNKSTLENKEDFDLMTLGGTSKTILYTCGQDDMEITRSHTTALECKTVSPDEIASRPADKTVMFVDNPDELEMTKSHTVFIDCQAEEKTVLPDRPNFDLFKRKSTGKPTMTYNPPKERVFFPENCESDHPAEKGSQLTPQEEWSNNCPVEKAVTFLADHNMEVSKSTILKNVDNIQKPTFTNELVLGKNHRRKSLMLKNDKTIAFSENDKNDKDITESHMVDINNKSTLENKDFHLVPLAGTSETVFYSCGQDDMEVTSSHITALECKTVSPDEVTTEPMDKTIMFLDNHNEVEVTKSHTVFIDCQATENVLQGNAKLGITKGKSLGVSFPSDDICVQEITKKQALARENKIVPHTEQKLHMIPFVPSNTSSGDQNKIEINKFHSLVKDEEAMWNSVDQPSTLEKAKIKSCHLHSTDRRNVDITSSHVTAICGFSDNYSCLPNVISHFDKLEGSVISLCDKDKENASNCQMQNDLAYANNLASQYCSNLRESEKLPLSAPCPLLEKEEAIQTNTKGQLDCVIALLKDQDLLKEPPNLLANQTLICSQDLGEVTKFNSKQISFKLLKDQSEASVEDICITSQPHLSTQQLPLPQKGQHIANKDEVMLSKTGNKNSNIEGNSLAPTSENESKMLNNEKQFAIPCEKELKENISTAKYDMDVDFYRNSDFAGQVTQTHDNAGEASDAVIVANTPCFSSINPNLNNLNRKTEELLDFQPVHKPLAREQLFELGNKAHNNMSIAQDTEIHDINIVSSDANAKDNGDENKNSHNEVEINSVPLKTVIKDKARRCSLGIFLPKLPNKRNCSVTGIDDLEQTPEDTTGFNPLETQPISSKDSNIGSLGAKLNLSPSQYINEEDFPVCPGEINSSDSISIETEENALIEMYQKEVSSENKVEKICSSQKRTWVQEEDDTHKEKKIRKSEIKPSATIQDQEIFVHHTEGDIDKNANSTLVKSLSRTPSSCSSSLDSIKADGTSLDFSTHRSSQMESQLLRDTICEESLKEKLKDGRITIREFFILLQVHILIQKPRQSNLPAKFTANIPPTSEDLMLSQYVYRPKIQIYREDCDVLRQKIEELKLSAANQDKLLIDINKNLWEKMRQCSDEELKTFGIYLNKIKSCFTKMTKVFTHQGKVVLYSKLVQSAQNEREKLQIRIDEMDNILKKINSSLTEVERETKNLEDEEKNNTMNEWNSEMRATEKELEQLKAEEEKLQRNLSELEVQKEQTLAQVDFIQKQTNRTEELLDQLSLSEWDVIEWSDEQAIFTFVYDTIELIITFGEIVIGLPFLHKAHRKIVDLNFQSLLDEDKAPPSSLLVHKLIFQYIEEQESWKKKCTTQHQVPKMLQELSRVVNHCRLLGEEIELLKRWGPNYNLMNIDVNNTELRLLFSSSAAFAKFEITLSLSAHYPFVPLPFTIQNHLGNISQDKIITILSKVPLEENYLKNVVKQIYQDLLRDCHIHH